MDKKRVKEIISIITNSGLIGDVTPVKVRETFEALGPTYIKIGQILSTRIELLPQEYILELTKLRSEVQPLPYEEIISILNQEYGDYKKYFKYIEQTPIGTASIAQVHKAITINDLEVAIKVKKPNIDEIMKEDIEILKEAVNFLHLNSFIKVMDLNLVLDELYKTTMQELDFENEKNNLVAFASKNMNERNIGFPYIIDNISNKNIIVMEYINGVPLSEVDKIKVLGYDTSAIADILCDNYIKQALEDGLFHADPHPDNIYISNNNVVFIDWGMAGSLTEKNKRLLNRCMESIVHEDYEDVTNVLIEMSTPFGEVNKSQITHEVEIILKKHGTADLETVSLRVFLKDMFDMLRKNNLRLDQDVTMLARGLAIISGVLKSLDSSLSLIQVLEDKVISKRINNFKPTEFAKKTAKQMMKTSRSVANLPTEVEQLVKKVGSDDFKFKFELNNSGKQIDKIEVLVHELILGFLDGCSIIGFATIKNQSFQILLGIIVVFITFILGVRIIQDIHHKGL